MMLALELLDKSFFFFFGGGKHTELLSGPRSISDIVAKSGLVVCSQNVPCASPKVSIGEVKPVGWLTQVILWLHIKHSGQLTYKTPGVQIGLQLHQVTSLNLGASTGTSCDCHDLDSRQVDGSTV